MGLSVSLQSTVDGTVQDAAPFPYNDDLPEGENDGKRRLCWHGMFLFLLGLLTGLVEQQFHNLIPLGPAAIGRIVEGIEAFPFEQIYGAWWKANVLSNAKDAVRRSAERYLRWISA